MVRLRNGQATKGLLRSSPALQILLQGVALSCDQLMITIGDEIIAYYSLKR